MAIPSLTLRVAIYRVCAKCRLSNRLGDIVMQSARRARNACPALAMAGTLELRVSSTSRGLVGTNQKVSPFAGSLREVWKADYSEIRSGDFGEIRLPWWTTETIERLCRRDRPIDRLARRSPHPTTKSNRGPLP